MKDYIAVDLETTGFSPDTSEILEIGEWKIKNGVVVDKFCTLVKPMGYIPRDIQALTKITPQDVQDCEPIETVLPSFFEWCEDLPFLGHNLSFSYDFLCVKGARIGLDFTLNYKRMGLDTLSLAKKYLKLKSNKLADVATYFNIDISGGDTGFHRASYDSYITKLIYDRFEINSTYGAKIPKLLSTREVEYGKVVNNDTLSFS